MSADFWKDKKVFVTGHTGFKGSWISLWLSILGARVMGYSLNPPTENNLFEISNVGQLVDSTINDIRNYDALRESIEKFNPEIVIHMAAQPLVRYSYQNPLETYSVNVIGTANLLDSIRFIDSVKSVVIVTSDKCYENDETSVLFKESDPMGGSDPYSSSKGCAELVTKAYRSSYFEERPLGIASVRAGNVIGGGDWAKDRLIPDILKSFDQDSVLKIRSPKAIRPWQHVLEPIAGYLLLAENLYLRPKDFSGPWNFGPNKEDAMTVESIIDLMSESLPKLRWEIETHLQPKESKILMLDINKSRSELAWKPIWSLQYGIKKIVEWHLAWKDNLDMQKICLDHIREYINA